MAKAKTNAMEDNQELFNRYIDDTLSAEDKLSFENRLASDKEFLSEFRLYLLVLKGICQEAEQDNADLGHAMKNISEAELRRIIGRSSKPRILRNNTLQERPGLMMRSTTISNMPQEKPKLIKAESGLLRPAWVASIVAILVIGFFAVFNVRQSGMDRLDYTIVAYNYMPDHNRGWEDITSEDIPSLEKTYLTAPADDDQAVQLAGMRLSMAYLKIHDRKKAKELLTELSARFADDEEFVAQCQKILSLLE